MLRDKRIAYYREYQPDLPSFLADYLADVEDELPHGDVRLVLLDDTLSGAMENVVRNLQDAGVAVPASMIAQVESAAIEDNAEDWELFAIRSLMDRTPVS